MAGSPVKCTNVGGQAVIEGVMMRTPNSFAVVCRRPAGDIVIREQPWHSIWNRLKFLKWPFLRGGVVLLEALINGMSALTFSAQQQEEAEAQDEDTLAWLDRERTFLRDHLTVWLPRFCQRVREASQHPFYAALAELTMTFVSLDVQRLVNR